ncbi:DUF3443 domain-containing protein [Noviherbaspirillum cavernae]|uniref:DUF3443 domain-containing protein n=1 Tax=Noviherbaspirillum cavernae TaxID=2320862 RepID=A0A418X4K2_9BURK|nr:DUF3443 domain-containing protein [Noviherbaspirillum cavernae]RJG07394.1 DUF3443 domain-containing protein [Noviherbaspirillum cavernae]
MNNCNRKLPWLARWHVLLLACVLALAACGGDDDDDSASGNGGSTGGSSTVAANAVSIAIGGGPANNINLPLVSVTICAPNSSRDCQTIDNMLVDTGSSGVRVYASVLAPSIPLPQELLADGSALVECAQFADGNTWGPVMRADIKMASQLATAIPIQVIADTRFPAVPTECVNSGEILDTVRSFGANGVLGIGVFQEDCGIACALTIGHGIYFSCTTATCRTVAAPMAQQVQNPVAFFATDNNGVAITLPAVPAEGAANVTGLLVFGIGTQSNNALGSATVLTVDPDTGLFTTIYKGNALRRSFIDSGSNGLFFPESTIPACTSGFYCPPATLSLTATHQGLNGVQREIPFTVANADVLIKNNPGARAYGNLGGPGLSVDMFDWGLPFYFGRTVFTAIEGRATPGGVGPYYAY